MQTNQWYIIELTLIYEIGLNAHIYWRKVGYLSDLGSNVIVFYLFLCSGCNILNILMRNIVLYILQVVKVGVLALVKISN